MCCCDGPSPAIYKCETVTARKLHTCCECLGPILAGHEYERVHGLWEGSWSKFATCLGCVRVREDYMKVAGDCACIEHGLLMDCLEQRHNPTWAEWLARRQANYEWRKADKLSDRLKTTEPNR